MEQIIEDFSESIDMEHVADSALDEIRPGIVIQGEVVTVDNEYAYVNVGTKSDGRIALEEFDESPEVGKIVKVMLQNRRLVDGVYQFSTKAAIQENSWQKFIDMYGNGNDVVSGKVSAATNKGKMVDCGGMRAFLPFSLSADLKGESSTEEDYNFKIKTIDRKKRSVVLSRKDYLEEENKVKWSEFLTKYNVGDTIEGEVVKFVEFGAFVRVEGIDALLHRNDMSWKNVFKQRKILKLNEKRQFVILNINAEEGKISLGLKQMADDPWLKIEEKYSVGDIVEGTVVTLVNTGVFVEIGDEIEGFLSNTEISWTQNAASAKSLFQKGDTINVMILDIKKDERRMLLGYKQTIENPWDTISQNFSVGSVHKSKIKKIVKFGLFVELENDIDGLVHISDISWDENRNDSVKKYSVGDEVEFKILDIKKDEMKISCGIKQLQKSPWEVINEKYRPRMLVNGVISGITPFGIFVKLEENVEGLVHISEVSKQRMESIEEHFSVGDAVQAVVLGVDVKKKRLSLSIKQYEYISEREEVDKILQKTSPSTVTLGDMIDIKLND